MAKNAPAAHSINGLFIKRQHINMLAILFLTVLISLLIVPTSGKAQQRSPDHQRYCLGLEAKLAKTYQSNESSGTNRAKVKINIRNVERIFHRLSNEAERRNCYSYFIFSKELRRTPRCIRIHRKIKGAKRQLAQLNNQLHKATQRRGNKKEHRTDLIYALARNKCGYQYEKAARKRHSFSNWFDDGFFGGTPQVEDPNQQDNFQFATHRTMCVRLCDGYYFPMSFATTQNRFSKDEGICQSKCAAPAKLFTYPNPGGEPEQMISVNGLPYGKIKHAWRFKKEFVKGCSCKATEYDPLLLEAKPKSEISAVNKETLKKETTPLKEGEVLQAPKKTAVKEKTSSLEKPTN